MPTKRYAAVQHNVEDARRRADSKIHDDKEAAGIKDNSNNPMEVERLTKAERSQYEADISRYDDMPKLS